MAPYLSDDQSVESAQPIELFEFSGPSSSFTYRYTSWHEDVTLSGDVYTAISVRRSKVAGATPGDDLPDMRVTLPISAQLVQDYAFSIPPRNITLIITRVHTLSGTSAVYWTGVVDSFLVQGTKATVRARSSLEALLDTRVPGVYNQQQCNHLLYDARCTILEASFTLSTTVSSFSGRTITAASVGGNPDGYYKAGWVTRTADGERRLVKDHTGSVLTISHPFRTLTNGNAIDLAAGCLHTTTACRDKFSNIVNFGGMPYIPIRNIIERGVRK